MIHGGLFAISTHLDMSNGAAYISATPVALIRCFVFCSSLTESDLAACSPRSQCPSTVHRISQPAARRSCLYRKNNDVLFLLVVSALQTWVLSLSLDARPDSTSSG